MRARRASRGAVALVLLVLLGCFTGCATAGQRQDAVAASRGLDVLRLDGGDFAIRAYARDARRAGDDVLHVYLEGDGRPWSGKGRRAAPDPHGEHTLAFELMTLDPARVLYLKRPCYQRWESAEPACEPSLWTAARYSETVVASLEAALRHHLSTRPAPGGIVWIGHSGGGVLARILAGRVAETVGLLTVAAPLDLAAWTARHGYEPLVGSLDPAVLPPLPEEVVELHLAGGRDENVPPEIVRSGPAGASPVVVVEEFGHVCCWRDTWPQILESFRQSR